MLTVFAREFECECELRVLKDVVPLVLAPLWLADRVCRIGRTGMRSWFPSKERAARKLILPCGALFPRFVKDLARDRERFRVREFWKDPVACICHFLR